LELIDEVMVVPDIGEEERFVAFPFAKLSDQLD